MTIFEMDNIIQEYCDSVDCDHCAIEKYCKEIAGDFTSDRICCEKAYEIAKDELAEDEPEDSPVNHPSHYNKGSIEVWDFISDWGLNFDRGNAIKYICRAGEKDPTKEVQDLKKAIEYINHEIKMLTKGDTENA